MSPLLSLIPISVMTFISMCADEIVESISKDYNHSKVVNFDPEHEQLEKNTILNSKAKNSAEVIQLNEPETEHNDDINSEEIDSNIRILHWKLKKNLETLVFLSELESHYANKTVLAEMIHEYYDIKKAVQIETVEISNLISYYKSLQNESA